MQLKDAQAHIASWENLNVVMLENSVPKVNFKGFMVYKLDCHEEGIW